MGRRGDDAETEDIEKDVNRGKRTWGLRDTKECVCSAVINKYEREREVNN